VAFTLSILGYIFADQFIRSYVQRTDTETLRLATYYFKWLLPSLPLAVAVGISGAANNARERFLIPALYGFVLNLGVLSFLVLVRKDPISLCWGVLAALTAQAILQFTVNARCRKKAIEVGTLDTPRPIDLHQQVYRALLPALIYSALGQTSVAVDRAFASILPTGNVAALGYASTLVNLPSSLFGATFATVLFARFSLLKVQGQTKECGESLRQASRWTLAITVPLAVWLALFAGPIVSLIFQRGKFDATAASLTTSAMVCLAPTVVSISFLHLLIRYINAQGRTQLLTKTALLAVTLNIVLDAILVRSYGLPGIAAGTSIVTTITASILFYAADKDAASKWISRNGWTSGAACLLGVLSVGAARIWFSKLLLWIPPTETIVLAVEVMAPSLIALAFYTICLKAMQKPLKV
jgi:putative peptidoglycan lipid II flippase